MLAILSLLIVAILSLLVTRIAALALVLTGMSSESARFQARSAFTGVGFTTSESESVVNHPVRRQIVMVLMLLGNVGIATVVATLIFSFISGQESDRWWWHIVGLVAGLLALWRFSTSKTVEKRLNRLILVLLKRWTHLDVRDYVAILQLQNGFAVSEMRVDAGDWLVDKSLSGAALAREGVLILGIQRKDEGYIGAPQAETRIYVGDTLVLYGPITRLAELDGRAAGEAGDAAHRAAVKEHVHAVDEQNAIESQATELRQERDQAAP